MPKLDRLSLRSGVGRVCGHDAVVSAPFVLVYSLDTVYTRSLTGFYGRSLIDLANFTVLATGTTNIGTTVATTVVMPNNNTLRGLQLTFQTQLQSGQSALSGPAMVVIGP
jgi:hypothetical protein